MELTVIEIMDEIKSKKIPISRVEKACGFSNGLLGKVSNLSEEKKQVLQSYYALHIWEGEPAGASLVIEEVPEPVEEKPVVKEIPQTMEEFCNTHNCTPQDIMDSYAGKMVVKKPDDTLLSLLSELKGNSKNETFFEKRQREKNGIKN